MDAQAWGPNQPDDFFDNEDCLLFEDDFGWNDLRCFLKVTEKWKTKQTTLSKKIVNLKTKTQTFGSTIIDHLIWPKTKFNLHPYVYNIMMWLINFQNHKFLSMLLSNA